MSEVKNKVGRKKGYKMSEESKAKTSKTRTGKKHDQKTKDQISQSLLKYFADRKEEV